MVLFSLSGWMPGANRKSAGSLRAPGRAKHPVSSLPRLELLEDRTVPSGSYVYSNIDSPNGVPLIANAINNRGEVVGNNPAFLDGFLLSHGQLTPIDDPNPPVPVTTFASGINDSGTIVGQAQDLAFVNYGFALSHGQYTTIHDPSAGHGGTFASGINDRGQIVGSYAAVHRLGGNVVYHGFVLSGGQYTTLPDATGSLVNFPNAINNLGQIVGFYLDSNFNLHSYVLSRGQYTIIDDPNGVGSTIASGINDLGQIVGSYTDANSTTHGFLLSGGQYTTLDDPNAGNLGTGVNGINNLGQFVGAYADANFVTHAFLATPAPPQSGLIASSSVAGLVAVGSQINGTSPGTLMASIPGTFQLNFAGSLGSKSTEQTTAIAASLKPTSSQPSAAVDALFARFDDLFTPLTTM
jgi:probable HAF family extracellular repeat protein